MQSSLHRVTLYFKTMEGMLTQHCPPIGQLDSRTPRCLTIGLLDTALSTIGLFGTALSVHSADKPLNSWTQHRPTIVMFDTTLSKYWTV